MPRKVKPRLKANMSYILKNCSISFSTLCSCQSSSKCQFSRFSDDDVISENTSFNSINSHDHQNEFLSRKILIKETPSNPKKSKPFYYLSASNKQFQVCKTSFISVFGISHKRIEKITEKLKSGEKLFKSNRGGFREKNQFDEKKTNYKRFPFFFALL